MQQPYPIEREKFCTVCPWGDGLLSRNEKERNKAKLMKSQKVREKDSKDREKRKENTPDS